MSRPEGEPRIPWYLLFSRSGRRPEEPSEAEDGILPAQESRSMSEREGRGAFLFWIAAGFVLCLLAALSAVSCGRHGEEQAESGSSVPWIVIFAAALLIILAVSVSDFVKAWKAQNKEASEKKGTGASSKTDGKAPGK